MNLNTVRVKIRIITIIFLASFVMASSSLAATYYVDATNGNDANAGVSQSAPWKTIAKVKASRFNPGDQILFKRGETWREQLTVPSSGSAGSPITFGAYGSGAKPKILGSIDLSSSSPWTVSAGNLWYATSSLQVGNLIFNNEASVGFKRSTEQACTTQGDFWWDGSNKVYLYSTSNPGTYYTAIEAAQRSTLVGRIYVNKDHLVFQDLDIRYEGSHGIQLDGYSSTRTDITIQRCNFAFIGGSYSSGTTREGNAIQVNNHSDSIIVRYNTINDIYDSGPNFEGTITGTFHSNITIHNNIMTRVFEGFQVIAGGDESYLTNILVANNIFYLSGGWGYDQKTGYDQTGVWSFGMWRNNSTKTNCKFVNNISYNPTLKHTLVYTLSNLTGWTVDYNIYYPDGAAMFTIFDTSYNFAGWKTATSQDAHSIVADPQFVSASDFHLQSTSPAINAGIDVGLTQDFDGNPISGVPNIGAFEFIHKPLMPPAGLRVIVPNT